MGKPRVCQYCGYEFDNKTHSRTAEHIIPKGIIELFPNEYISISQGKSFIDYKGMTIADVCKYCNGTLLSPLDKYGRDLINNQFLDEVPFKDINNSFQKSLDYHLLSRWLLKIIYNHQRSIKGNTSWFKDALGYILYGLLIENFDFSIFAGIHINTTPLPEKSYNYLPMQINDNPLLLGSSLGLTAFGVNPLDNSMTIPFSEHTYCIRFGTAIFYCILWNKGAHKEIKDKFNLVLSRQFCFTRIVSDQSEYPLKCVSAHTNTILGYKHLLSKSAQKQDQLIVQNTLGGRTPDEAQKEISQFLTPEYLLKGQALNEVIEFPDNPRSIKKYNNFYTKE